MFAVDINGTRTHLVREATERDARAIAGAFKSQAYRVAVREVRKAVWVGPHREDTEDCWVPEYTYTAL